MVTLIIMKKGFEHHNKYTQSKPGEVAWLVSPRIVSSLFFLPIAGSTPPYLAWPQEIYPTFLWAWKIPSASPLFRGSMDPSPPRKGMRYLR